jgi:anti-anti-sigma factor
MGTAGRVERVQFSVRRVFESLTKGDEITIDLENVEAIDAAGLGMLASEYTRARDKGVRLIVENPTRLVRETLSITGLDTVLLRGGEPPTPAAMKNPVPGTSSGGAAAPLQGAMTPEDYGAAYEKNFGRTVSLTQQRGFTREDAMDIAQDAWLRGFQKLRQLKNPSAVSAWVNQIARRSGRPTVRRINREAPLPEGGPVLTVVPEKVGYIDLRRALDSCRSRDFEILRRVEVMGESTREVANALNTTDGAVHSALWRAKRQLKSRLAGGQHGSLTTPHRKRAA